MKTRESRKKQEGKRKKTTELLPLRSSNYAVEGFIDFLKNLLPSSVTFDITYENITLRTNITIET